MPHGCSTVRWVTSVPSTQDAVHALAEQGAVSGTGVAALEQTAGRGARGSEWAAGAGGLWLSVLLRPRESAALDVLSVRVGLAVIELLEARGARDLMLKWPNDIFASGRKAGGILCEARWTGDRPAWVVVGVGLNVTNDLPAALMGEAARLADHGLVAELDQLATLVADAVVAAGAARGPLADDERVRLGERDWLAGRQLAAPRPGVAVGISADGALLIRQHDGAVVALRAAPVRAAARVSLAE